MTAFDAHAHVIVPELLRDADPGEAWRPTVRVAGLADAAQAAVPHGNAERELRRAAVAGGPRG
ncbi:MAG TPA: hypothetical protein VHW04_04240 [Solirubrobacteraceae bacterium]|jgi:hypothetical protein|nr:hypothetical protein [Solirubrobacteraceae bacterium]